MNQDSLHCSVIMGREETVYGQTATGDGREGVVCGAKDPLQGRGAREIDPRQ